MYLYMVFYYIIELKGGNMSSWFDYDEDGIVYSNSGIYDEIFADTALRLGPHTLLYTYLCSQDLTQDYIKVTTDDLESARIKFINCGYPLVLKTYNKSQLINWFKKMDPYIKSDLTDYNNSWIANINKLADVDTLTDHEISLLWCDEKMVRNWLLLFSLQINVYKIAGQRKTKGILPNYLYWESPGDKSHEEVKKHVLTWKHVPSRFKNE